MFLEQNTRNEFLKGVFNMNAVIEYIVTNFTDAPLAFSISTVALILEIAIYQFRGMRAIVIGQCILNFLIFFTLVLGNGVSGAAVCIIATIQTFLVYWMYQRKEKEVSVWFTLVFIACYIIASVITFKEFVDVLPIFAAVLFAISVVQSESWKYRLIILVNSLMWLAYNILISSPVPLVAAYVIAVTSIVVGIVRLDIKKGLIARQGSIKKKI